MELHYLTYSTIWEQSKYNVYVRLTGNLLIYCWDNSKGDGTMVWKRLDIAFFHLKIN